jgi:predicted nucleotidyltransferase
MHADIAEKREELTALCRRFDTARLEVFGSAARGGGFDAARSDADFLVELKPDSTQPPLERFLGLAEALERLLIGRRSAVLISIKQNSQSWRDSPGVC